MKQAGHRAEMEFGAAEVQLPTPPEPALQQASAYNISKAEICTHSLA